MPYEFQGRTRAKVEAESRRRRAPRAPREPRAPASGVDREPRVPMHAFAATVGLVFVLLGILGFVPAVTSNYDELELAGPESGAKLLGLFEVSVLHNFVHLFSAVGLIAAARYAWAQAYLIGGGIVYLAMVAYGFLVDLESNVNFLPFNDADNLLHLVLGLGMVAWTSSSFTPGGRGTERLKLP